MTRKSAAARAASDDDLEIDYSERAGFLTGKAAALAEWQHKKLKNDPEFRRLIWRLQAKKYWATKPEERKKAIRAYRKAWAKARPDHLRLIYQRARRKRRSDPKKWRAELDAKKAKREIARRAKRAATVYTCCDCGTQWSPGVGRLPARPPIRCPNRCRTPEKLEKQRLAMQRLRAKWRSQPTSEEPK